MALHLVPHSSARPGTSGARFRLASQRTPTLTIGSVPSTWPRSSPTRMALHLVPHSSAHPGTSGATFRLALQRTRPITIGTVPTAEPSAIQRSSAPRGTGRRGGGGGPGTEGRASPVEACRGRERRPLGPRGGLGGGRVRGRALVTGASPRGAARAAGAGAHTPPRPRGAQRPGGAAHAASGLRPPLNEAMRGRADRAPGPFPQGREEELTWRS